MVTISTLDKRINDKIKNSAESLITEFDTFHRKTLRDLLELLGSYAKIQTFGKKEKARQDIFEFQASLEKDIAEFSKKADYLLYEAGDRDMPWCPKTYRRLDIMRQVTYAQLETFWESQGVVIDHSLLC